MEPWIFSFSFLACSLIVVLTIWARKDRKYKSSISVSSAYDSWTNDRLLENLWGEHVHLGYYVDSLLKTDFECIAYPLTVIRFKLK